MGVRRCGASGREALVEDLAKGAPMLHNRTKDPVSWREKRSLSPIGHQNRLETAQEGVLGQTNQEATLKLPGNRKLPDPTKTPEGTVRRRNPILHLHPRPSIQGDPRPKIRKG